MPIDERGSRQQVVAHRGELRLAVLLQQAGALLRQRAIVLAGLLPAELGHLDQDLAAVGRVADASHQAAALEAVEQGGGRRRGQPGGGGELAGGLRAVEEPIETAQVGAVEPEAGGDGVVEGVGAALEGLGGRADGADERLTPRRAWSWKPVSMLH